MKISHIFFISLLCAAIDIAAAEKPTDDHRKGHNHVPNLHLHKKNKQLTRSDGTANTPTGSPSNSQPGTPANTPKQIDTPKDLKNAIDQLRKEREKNSTPK